VEERLRQALSAEDPEGGRRFSKGRTSFAAGRGSEEPSRPALHDIKEDAQLMDKEHREDPVVVDEQMTVPSSVTVKAQ